MPFIPGQSYSSFTLKRHAKIAEIGSDVYLFEHDVLGCPLLAIKNSDPNKTFAAAFNTTPTDSTGVAHILEHSVLMGSKKYPVNDVFGEINKGGLMTFLNAMTGSDITYYPFATLKTECVRSQFGTRAQARTVIFEYISLPYISR